MLSGSRRAKVRAMWFTRLAWGRPMGDIFITIPSISSVWSSEVRMPVSAIWMYWLRVNFWGAVFWGGGFLGVGVGG